MRSSRRRSLSTTLVLLAALPLTAADTISLAVTCETLFSGDRGFEADQTNQLI